MTDRSRRPATGTAAKVLATGASVAAGLGLIGLIEATAAGPTSGDLEVVRVESPSVTIIRRVVVPTTSPDIVLQHTMGASRLVVREAPAPVVRTRTVAVATQASAPRPAPAQSSSSGS